MTTNVTGTIVQDNKIIFKLTPEYQTVGITELQIVLIEILDDGRCYKNTTKVMGVTSVTFDTEGNPSIQPT